MHMTEYADTYCPECDAEIRAALYTQPATLVVRGEEIAYSETVAICPNCGGIVGDARIEGANVERAYNVYRALHGILSPGEIKALRHTYGLSLREFSKFLGFGEQTTYRYEHGDLPDQAHNTTMLSAKTPDGAQLLLSQNRLRLNNKSVDKIERHIQALIDGTADRPRSYIDLADLEAASSSSTNGYRRLDVDRLAALVYELATRCHDLYWTKLQKALFFADMISYERFSCSLTGMSYAHATHGPVMDHKDEVRYILVNRGTIRFRERGWGEIVVALQPGSHPFTTKELALIDEVASFVNSFDTATELSDFSHKLTCWSTSADGEIIEYTSDTGEVGSAMRKRMSC